MRTQTRSYQRQAGLSLVELMIALVAGLIVAGSVLAFTISSLQSNTQYVQATRLSQELRAAMDYVSRDLRRAGFDQAFVDQLSQLAGSATISAFSPILLDGSCVVYAYDRSPFNATTRAGTVDLSNGEVRGIRRVVVTIGGVDIGVLEVAESSAGSTPTCDAASANYAAYPPACNGLWCPLTDPRVINIQAFTVVRQSQDVVVPASDTTSLRSRIRDLDITLTGALVADPVVSKTTDTRIRVRADCLRPPASVTAGACEASPVGI